MFLKMHWLALHRKDAELQAAWQPSFDDVTDGA